MSDTDVLVVRLYLHESKSQMEELLQYLHDETRFVVSPFLEALQASAFRVSIIRQN